MSTRLSRMQSNLDANPYVDRLDKLEERRALTHNQRAFLNECISSQRTVVDVMADRNITPQRMGRWLSQTGFCKELRRLAKSLGQVRDFDLSVASQRGAELLIRTVDGCYDGTGEVRNSKGEVIRKAKAGDATLDLKRKSANDIIKFAHDAEARRRTERKLAALPTPPLVHPDVGASEVQRLLDQMEGAEGAD